MLLYGFGPSRSLRASWALEEVGAPWSYYKLNARAGEHRSDEFLSLNPDGKVPCLVDQDFVLTESMAIVTYLGEKFPDSGLVPAKLNERALYFQWSSFAVTELEQPLWTKAKHSFVFPKEKRVPAIKPVTVVEFERAAKVFSLGLGDKEFVLGRNFTGADILLGHTLSWARMQKYPIEHSNLNEYLDRLLARPAYNRARQREVEAPLSEASEQTCKQTQESK